MSDSYKVKGFGAGILAAVFYGTNPLGSLPLYADHINAGSVLFYRYAIATAIFALWMAVRGESFGVRARHLARFAMLGSLFALSSVCLYVSFLYMDAGVASTILFSYPIMVAVLMSVFFHERVTWTTISSVLLATLGIGLLYRGDGVASASRMGMAFVVMSSLLYAVYIIAVQRWNHPYSPLKFTFWIVFFGTVTVLLFTLAMGETIQPLHGVKEWTCAVQLALLPTVLSLLFMNIAISHIGSTPSAIMGALEPVTAVAISVTLFGESFTPQLAFGIVLILSAVMLIILRKQPRKS